jgi:hypothetical protein
MKDLKSQYEAAKQRAIEFMQNGQISAYLKSLREINEYKNLMNAIVAN